MASRMQFQDPLVEQAVPSLRVEQERLVERKTAALLAKHPIESELVGRTPRWVRRVISSEEQHGHVGIASLLYLLIIVFKQLSASTLYLTVAVFLFIAGCIAFGLRFLHQRRSQSKVNTLLREGHAVPAVVIDAKDGPRDTTLRIKYRNALRQITDTSISLPTQTVYDQQLKTDATFTLMISTDAEEDHEAVPYFQTRTTFEVLPLPATQASRDASARLHAADILAVASFQTATSRIEQELLQSTPRRLKLSREFFPAGLWTAAVLSFYASLIAILWGKIITDTSVLVFTAIIGHLVYVYVEVFWRSTRQSYRILRYQAPATATIYSILVLNETKNRPAKEQVLQVYYSYSPIDGKKCERVLTCARRTAWQRGITEGATFTVLYDPRRPDQATPYFEIGGMEIVGAMGARISPP